MINERKIYFVDLFCGAGGVTTGIHRARYAGKSFAKVIACVNHDPLAIASHEYNHPDCIHYIEKIQVLDLTELRLLVERLRREDPDCLIFIWASLECTNFSKAKGGLPRDGDSRTLAEHMYRYVEELQPDGLWFENVEEFMAWGPLDENGKPISKRNGEDYLRWVNQVQTYGYNFDYRILNAADFGAYTSRRRYFAQFMRPGIPIVWPEATHAKKPAAAGMFGSLKKWKPVKDVLDFKDEGQSIFTRKKPLSEKTLERIYAGLIKYVAGGKDAFIANYYSGDPKSMVIPVDGPAATIRTTDAQALVVPVSILKYNSMTQQGVHIPSCVEEPAPTVACQARMGVVSGVFLTNYYSNGGEIGGTDAPACTLSTKDRIAKVQACWLDKNYSSGNHNHQPVTQPAGAILTNDKHALVTTESSFLMGTNYDNKPTSLFAPAPTITANRKWSYLVNPSWGGHPSPTDQPSPVIIARGDKAPMYLVQTETGELGIQIFEADSPCMVKIKQFMAAYGVIDIKMRMLKIPELLRIQGFGDGYALKGTQADQKRFIGNAVEVNQAKVLIEASYAAIITAKELKTA